MTPSAAGPISTGISRIADAARWPRPAVVDETLLRALVAEEVERRFAQRVSASGDLEFTMTTLVGGRPGANRTLNERRWNALARQIGELTGVADLQHQLAQEYLGLLDVESRGLGRLAGSTYNILGKLLVPALLGLPDGPILEIGTLYGLFAPTLVRSFRRRGQIRELTVVDPLVGNQLQDGRPIAADRSGTPVVEDVVRWNFRELGLDEAQARVVVGYSTDPAIRAEAGDRRYAVVVVDGDHYEAGVLADLHWAETILAPGGIAVLDDFGDDKWPGVEAAARRYLDGGGRMELLGVASTSGYLRLPA
jgi:hypothetical protein